MDDVWSEMAWNPTQEELEAEREYWALEDARHEYAEWEVSQFEAMADFSTWPTADLMEELEIVRTVTPDQEDVFEELQAEIAKRQRAAA